MSAKLSTKPTVLFSGMVAAVPNQGGATWAVLQYLLGLKRLGCEVYFVEPMEASAIRPEGLSLSDSTNAAYFRQVMSEFGLLDNSALLLSGTRETVGLPYERLLEAAKGADLLLNISGMLADERILGSIPVRAYLDLDPAFNQFWQAVYGIDMRFGAHTHFVTVGTQIGQPGCTVPTCGLPWITTLQPVVLDQWPVAHQIQHDALTTIANWRGYGSVEHEGVFYGQKAHSLRQFIELPMLTDETFLLALAIHPAETKDIEALDRNRWQIIDPAPVTATPDDYRRFIQGSKAEFGIAKSGYVLSRSGWFSDRSVCYLASGRPVIAQDTGFSAILPISEGLFAFETVGDVLAAIDALNADYPAQARAARRIAEEYFDSDKVLTRILDRLGGTP